MTGRTFLLCMALVGFAGLAIIDLTHGHYRTGAAGGPLVIVNALLLA